jgi:serine/threonine protein kinase
MTLQSTTSVEGTTRPVVARSLLQLEPTDPRQLGGYTITHRLPGGSAETLKLLGYSSRDGSTVVLKVATCRSGGAVLSRMEREVEAAKRVRSSRVARVLDSGVEGTYVFMVQEFAQGRPLSELLAEQQEGRLKESDALRLAVGSAEALVDIHAAGVVHGDITPSNIIVGNRRMMVVDLGASQVSGRQQVELSGTPRYMSPEQQAGQEIDERSDVYVWALTVVRAAAGRHAFDPKGNLTREQYERRVAIGRPDLSKVPRRIRPAVEAALQRDRAARPTAEQLVKMLTGGDDSRTVELYTRVLTTLHLATPAAPVIPLSPRPRQLLKRRNRQMFIHACKTHLYYQLGSSHAGWLIGGGVVAILAVVTALLLRWTVGGRLW